MRSFFRIFALITFIGDIIVALGTIYPQMEQAWAKYQERKEALKTQEEKEADHEEHVEEKQQGPQYAGNVKPIEHANIEDVNYEEIKNSRL